MRRWAVFLALAFAVLGGPLAAPLPLSALELPPGFAIEVFARVPNARQMALGKNTLFVGCMRAGQVYAVPLRGARTPVVIADRLEMPVGVAFRDGDPYVSAVGAVAYESFISGWARGGLGAAGRRAGAARRQPARLRRPRGRDLSRRLPGRTVKLRP